MNRLSHPALRAPVALAAAALLSLLAGTPAGALPPEEPILPYEELARLPDVVARKALMSRMSAPSPRLVVLPAAGDRPQQAWAWSISGAGTDSAMDELSSWTPLGPIRVMGYGPRLAGVIVESPMGVVAVLRRKKTGGAELVSGLPGFVPPQEAEVLQEWRTYEALLADATERLGVATLKGLKAWSERPPEPPSAAPASFSGRPPLLSFQTPVSFCDRSGCRGVRRGEVDAVLQGLRSEPRDAELLICGHRFALTVSPQGCREDCREARLKGPRVDKTVRGPNTEALKDGLASVVSDGRFALEMAGLMCTELLDWWNRAGATPPAGPALEVRASKLMDRARSAASELAGSPAR